MKGHVKRKTLKKVLWALVLIFIIFAIVHGIKTNKPVSLPKSDDGVSEVMKRENFRKQEENRARQIYLTEQMTKLKAEYESKNTELETQLEAARKDELSLQ